MLEKHGVVVATMPAGGWRYEQPLATGGAQRIPARGCAGTDTSLIEQVKLYRVNAGIDIAGVEEDIADYIKAVSPMNDRFPKRTQKQKGQPRAKEKFRPYLERIRDWLLVIAGKQPRLLIEDEADERAQKCMTPCPQNVKWITGCQPCCDVVKSRGQNLRQRPSYKNDKGLGACRLHDLYLPAAVFIDRDFLPQLNVQAPDFCWLRDKQ